MQPGFDSITFTFSKNSNYGWERCKGKKLLDVFNKLLNTKSLLTMPSNILPLRLMQSFPSFFQGQKKILDNLIINFRQAKKHIQLCLAHRATYLIIMTLHDTVFNIKYINSNTCGFLLFFRKIPTLHHDIGLIFSSNDYRSVKCEFSYSSYSQGNICLTGFLYNFKNKVQK